MFHNDAAHTGYSTGTGPTTNQTLWVFQTNGEIWSSPAVANGIVYIASRPRSVKPSLLIEQSNIYAINATTGAKIWSIPMCLSKYFSSPAVANGLVYIGD